MSADETTPPTEPLRNAVGGHLPGGPGAGRDAAAGGSPSTDAPAAGDEPLEQGDVPAAGGEPQQGEGPAADDVPGVVPVDLRDWVDFTRERATRVRVLATASLAQDLWCLEPQQATEVLLHEDADVAYTVLGGRAWFVTDQGEVGLDPLGSVLVPRGVAHGIDNRGADPLIVLAAATPPTGDGRTDRPLTRIAAAVRPNDTTGSVGARLRAFLAGER